MSSSQKFIARNRAPRVQIEYDVELYGAEKKVQLPFVMGVLSDLAGKSEQPPVADRKFLEIDVDNFDERMKSMAPRAAFTVPDTLTGEGNMAVDITFQSLEDFSPGAIAAKVPALAPLLEARRQLDNLMAYMDGKSGAEALIENLLAEPALLAALGGSGGGDRADMEAALDSLRARMPDPEPADDGTDRTLADLAARAPTDAPAGPSVDDILGTVEARPEAPQAPGIDDVLGGIDRRQDAPDTAEADAREAALDALRNSELPETEEDRSGDVLAGLARSAPEEPEDRDETVDVLAGIERKDADPVADKSADILAGIDRKPEVEAHDETGDVLAAVERSEDTVEVDSTSDVLAGIERRQEADVRTDEASDVLAGIERREAAEETDNSEDVLAGIERKADAAPEDRTEDILASVEPAAEVPNAGSDLDDVLAGLEPPEEPEPETDDSGAILDDLKDSVPVSDDPGDSPDDILAGIDTTPPPEDDVGSVDHVLASFEPAAVDSPPSTADSVALRDAQAQASDAPRGEADDSADTPPDATEATGDDRGAVADDGGSDHDLDALLADLGPDDSETATSEKDAGATDTSDGDDPGSDDLDALLSDLDGDETSDIFTDDQAGNDGDEDADDDLDALLADLGGDDDATAAAEGDGGNADARLSENAAADDGGSDDDLDALLADLGPDDGETATSEKDVGATDTADGDDPGSDDLDALLADLGASDVGTTPEESTDDPDQHPGRSEEDEAPADETGSGNLDDLLADMGAAEVGDAADRGSDDLDALLADLTGGTEGNSAGGDDDLDALLADMGTTELGEETVEDTAAETAETVLAEAPAPAANAEVPAASPQSPYGTISAPQPERDGMNRNRFRMAIFGDFTGRSSRGLMETGEALAARRPIELDVDTIEDVIEGFATTLTLPIGKDGAGIEVRLEELDDLHPDELYEKVEIFDAIAGLRQQLSVGSMAGRATEQLKGWAAEFGTPVKLPKRSAGTSVPPDLKLSDFQALIGDTRGTLTKSTPADDLIARIVGPHVVKAPDAGAAEMLEAVDEALSAAMRLVLHHPDFQAVESQWRSLDLLARRIETDSELQIVLYDVSAEELAADLSAQEDLAESGLYRLLTEVMDPEDGDGGFSALFGLYTFEETPPHAELLARVGLVAAHVDAPFFAAITPAYLETPPEDRHKLVASAWDKLRALPQAAYLGLASPRFMLRQPYGAKSDPCYEFEFEEFTPKEGLKGLLWANPVVLVAILLAATHKKDGRAMELGSLMSLGDIPFTFVTDRYGDQVALPCTERNLTSDAAQATLVRGYMPVLSIKGRNEVRLGSFRSLAGGEIAGPWADAPPARLAPPQATLAMDIAAAGASGGEVGDGGGGRGKDPLADPGGLLDTGGDAESGDAGDALDLLDSGDDDDGQSLDDLLASFADDDDADDDDDDDDIDPELAALLEGL